MNIMHIEFMVWKKEKNQINKMSEKLNRNLSILIKEKMSIVAESNTFIEEKENNHNNLNIIFNDIPQIWIYLIKMIEQFENFEINQRNLGINNNYINLIFWLAHNNYNSSNEQIII